MSKKQTTGWPALAAVTALSGCEGIQSALTPQGPAARAIAEISWAMFWGAAAILLLVMGLALYAVYRNPHKKPPSANAVIVAGGVLFPVAVLSALLAWGVQAMANLRAFEHDGAVRIEVVGNQWWWDVHYLDGAGGAVVATANEIHIPLATPVHVSVRTNDVIHSFWVPKLAGKIDMVPGRTNRIVLQADSPGVFRGQCAEFCGAQHARMALFVIAEPVESYRAWLAHQRAPAPAPADPAAMRGRDAFVEHGCIACHTVRGLGAARARGPDLTHVASRRMLAAGTFDNTPDNLIAFIARSQQIKPGSGMPSHPHLDQATLQALAAYLGSLR